MKIVESSPTLKVLGLLWSVVRGVKVLAAFQDRNEAVNYIGTHYDR